MVPEPTTEIARLCARGAGEIPETEGVEAVVFAEPAPPPPQAASKVLKIALSNSANDAVDSRCQGAGVRRKYPLTEVRKRMCRSPRVNKGDEAPLPLARGPSPDSGHKG